MIRLTDGKRWEFLPIPKYKYIKLIPKTVEHEYHQESENVTSWTTNNLGKTFNLGGGGSDDETLEYEMRGHNLYDYARQFDEAVYFIEYSDNFGKRKQIEIKELVKESVKRGY